MQIPIENYLAISEGIIGSFRQDRDKRRFFVLFVMLLVTIAMNVANAQTIKEYGNKLDQHSIQLHDLNNKFERVLVAMSSQKDRDSEQDERLKELERENEEQDEKNKEQDKRIDKLEEE